MQFRARPDQPEPEPQPGAVEGYEPMQVAQRSSRSHDKPRSGGGGGGITRSGRKGSVYDGFGGVGGDASRSKNSNSARPGVSVYVHFII